LELITLISILKSIYAYSIIYTLVDRYINKAMV